MTCKDCIHENVCESLIESGLPFKDEKFPAESFCLNYKSKGAKREVVLCSNCKKLRLYHDGVHSHQCSLYHIRFKHSEINDHYCSHGERKEEK